ncbi:MAG: dihydropteroate synthase [Nitrospina sp.]|jgi:dihydropteroate synthase|nr:dihydropteroate synthase [Nitrospina sp.]MBT3877267.1 dihydropteroate synthase [Nitrospina sp.]MBT4046862.1 dihydropteroate synthase [Nitrospina sp.]MBT4557416.1 dihydropteroate synthase [Nitrospina sp.]MBT5349507.1 dihydropteroate synthase [Nitrospina sp.]
MIPFRFPHPGEGVLVMGIINLSPESFYDASRCETLQQALSLANEMIEEGANVLDIGAESSRPGSVPLSEQEELKRLLPVVEKLADIVNIPISVDTYKPAVAQEVLKAGASIINDITGLQRYPEMAKTISRFQAGVIVMHMQGTPKTMQDNPQYADLMTEISECLNESISIAISAGIDPNKIAIDPGIGFGKTDSHNLQILKKLSRLKELGKPVLLGISRKSLIGNILNVDVEDRLEGSLSATVFGVMQGASIIRTHDVQSTRRAVKVAEAIINEKG